MNAPLPESRPTARALSPHPAPSPTTLLRSPALRRFLSRLYLFPRPPKITARLRIALQIPLAQLFPRSGRQRLQHARLFHQPRRANAHQKHARSARRTRDAGDSTFCPKHPAACTPAPPSSPVPEVHRPLKQLQYQRTEAHRCLWPCRQPELLRCSGRLLSLPALYAGGESESDSK